MNAEKLAAIRAELAKIAAVSNHANRSKLNRSESANPTPDEIREARDALGLTQADAARFVHSNARSWQNWEAPKDSPEHRRMHPAIWELFRIKTEHLRRD